MIDPICRRYGIRMIVVDRPGIGATPVVPLDKRIEISCRKSPLPPVHISPSSAHRWVEEGR
jgi:hypothetical protein